MQTTQRRQVATHSIVNVCLRTPQATSDIHARERARKKISASALRISVKAYSFLPSLGLD